MENSLSWWERLKIAVMPKSYAEKVVDDIYGPDGRGLIPVPQTYDPTLASEPAVYVSAKQSIGAAAVAVKDSVIKYGIIAVVIVAALVAINAFIRR